MSDIATVWRGAEGQWQVSGPSLLTETGLYSAVLISLFTDRLATPGDELPDRDLGGRRGWWADAYAEVAGDLIGSRLWLLARQKVMPRTLRLAEEYARDALQWLMDDGIARRVDVTAELLSGRPMNDGMALTVTVTRSAEPVARYRFETFWKGD